MLRESAGTTDEQLRRHLQGNVFVPRIKDMSIQDGQIQPAIVIKIGGLCAKPENIERCIEQAVFKCLI